MEARAGATPHDPRWFDFWILFGTGTAALIGLSASVVGLGGRAASRTLAFFLISAPYAAVTAAIAVAAPRRAGLPVLPVVENWRNGQLKVREALHAAAVAVAVAIASLIGAFAYLRALTRLLGRTPVKRHVTASALSIVCGAIVEEFLFRLVVFALLAASLQWLWKRLSLRSTAAPIWSANVLQALVFGAAHAAAGLGGLQGRPWYVRIPLITQSWTGLILGWMYWRYGIESAVVCHATFDLILFGLVRAHRLRP